MGSGHILAYAFDVLMQIYTSVGYLERDAAEAILEHNLYGLDIDDRAYQLAYFSVLMKARQYSRRILRKHPQIHICAIEDSQGLQKWSEVAGQDGNLEQLSLDDQYVEMADYLIDTFKDAKEFGSLITVEKRDYQGLLDYIDRMKQQDTGLFMSAWIQEMADRMPGLVKQAEILSDTYWACVTNPPYMSASNMNPILNQFIRVKYPDYKSDLFSACIFNFTKLTKPDGYLGFLSPYVWMFIAAYERLRLLFLNDKTIQSLFQFEYSAFEEATVPICSFVLFNKHIIKKGNFLRLTDFRGGMDVQRKKALEAIESHDRKVYYEVYPDRFSEIPGSPIAYWASDKLLDIFATAEKLSDIAHPRKGLVTTDNNRFLRFWTEVSIDKLGIGFRNKENALLSSKKWFPLNKGGEYRKWYGNNFYVINWENDGEEIKNTIIKHYHGGSYTKEIRSESTYFLDSITWSALTAGNVSFRFSNYGALFDSAGSSMFPLKVLESGEKRHF